MDNDKDSLSQKILAYIKGRERDKVEKLEKDIAKISGAVNESDLIKLEVLQQKLRDEKSKHSPNTWLCDASKRAKQLNFVTHVLKYIHGDAKGSNFFEQSSDANQSSGLVTTQSIAKPVIDITGNAAALDVGKLLMLVGDDRKPLIDYILEDNPEPLLPFAKDMDEAKTWLLGFKEVFANTELRTHKFGKQIYWPVGDSYHLLTPLFASSLAQAIYDKRKEFREVQFSKEEGAHANGFKIIPDLAVQTFGGTNQQNISQLNSQRGGKNFLLNCRPPVWSSIEKPPLNTESVFKSAYPGRVYKKEKAAHRLKAYLESVVDKASDIDIREARKAGVDELVDVLLLYAVSVQALPGGWSADPDCKLPLAEQLWLDPKRAAMDEAFRLSMEEKTWHDEVASRFAAWLNKKLQSDTLNLGDVEHKQWKVLVAQELRLTEQARKEYF